MELSLNPEAGKLFRKQNESLLFNNYRVKSRINLLVLFVGIQYN